MALGIHLFVSLQDYSILFTVVKLMLLHYVQVCNVHNTLWWCKSPSCGPA